MLSASAPLRERPYTIYISLFLSIYFNDADRNKMTLYAIRTESFIKVRSHQNQTGDELPLCEVKPDIYDRTEDDRIPHHW